VVTEEIKQTIMIAVSAILLSSLLGFVSFLMMVRSDFASVRNAEVSAVQTMGDFREFNKYNGATLYGEDVVAGIRDYYNSSIKIRVKKVDGTYYPSPTGSMDKYMARQDIELVTLKHLQGEFMTDLMLKRKYKAILVYGQVDPATITVNWTPSSSTGIDTNVSAIVFFDIGERVR
jgi:hypothetical protein